MPDVTLSAGAEFPEGSKVTAYARTGDNWPGAGGLDAVKTATSDGHVVVFKGLDAGTYWAAGDGGHKAFSSKDVPPRKVPVKARGTVDPQRVPRVPERVVITGPRGSLVYSHTNSGEQLVESRPGDGEGVPQPHVNQFTVGDGVQRSSTVFGEGTPKDVGESQPRDRQEDVPDGVFQASSTAKGEATVLDEQPAKSVSGKRAAKKK